MQAKALQLIALLGLAFATPSHAQSLIDKSRRCPAIEEKMSGD